MGKRSRRSGLGDGSKRDVIFGGLAITLSLPSFKAAKWNIVHYGFHALLTEAGIRLRDLVVDGITSTWAICSGFI